MKRYQLRFGGESLIVKENAAKSNRAVTSVIVSFIFAGSALAAIFFGGIF